MEGAESRKASTPRLSGRVLALLSRVVRSPAGGPLRRFLGNQLVDAKLRGFDFEAHGSPAPMYMPRPYK